jgi:hypothetical protein
MIPPTDPSAIVLIRRKKRPTCVVFLLPLEQKIVAAYERRERRKEPLQKGASSMNQKQRARRDELAREHQLGQLELQSSGMAFRRVALFAVVLVVVALLAVGLVIGIAVGPDSIGQFVSVFILTSLIIFGLAVPGSFLVYLVNNITVSLYTRGLVYLGVTRETVALWEDIRKVRIIPSTRGSPSVVILLRDRTTGLTTRVRSPTLCSAGSASASALAEFITFHLP